MIRLDTKLRMPARCVSSMAPHRCLMTLSNICRRQSLSMSYLQRRVYAADRTGQAGCAYNGHPINGLMGVIKNDA